MKNLWFYNYSIGKIGIACENGFISDIFFEKKNIKDYLLKETELLKKASLQLYEYFGASRKVFDLPLTPSGTPFQIKVWNTLLEIPYGQTVSYKDVSIKIGNPKANRAVGNANNKNPIAIVIPCHRIIGSDGSLVGYAGGLDLKKYLIELEKGNLK